MVSAICAIAPSQLFSAIARLSNSSPHPASIPCAAARSVLLNISLSILAFSPSLIPASAALRSEKVALSGRIFPLASSADTPSASSASFAVSVGAESESIMFRRCVPPSAPLMPRLARTPSAALSSTVPPASDCAVPPTVRIASPSCETFVFALLAVLAISSPKRVRFSLVASIPSAAIASVARSEAYARSIPPAAARLSTAGSASAAFAASYPASAR